MKKPRSIWLYLPLNGNRYLGLIHVQISSDSCYQTVICNLMEICFPTKIVTRHTADKPWVTDWFRDLVRKRQRTHMSGDLNQAKILRNKVNRVASKLTYNFYQTQIAAMHESGSHDWWKHMKTIMGLKTNGKSCMQGLAKKNNGW